MSVLSLAWKQLSLSIKRDHQPRRMSVVQSPCTRFLLIFGPSLAVKGCSMIDPRLHCDQRLSRDYTDLAEGGPNLILKALNYLGQTRG